ncbi:hypothetical protein KZX50_11970 [Bacillus infantis]|uniref:hypothetical protein n=1 Tax=Bacillus infantis TaxID=324767 RepID=UPI00114076BD|nr:hypothetical protein [Bacillus infantis]MCK6206162.1 hypothetical protein [Bacillus infantis]
MKMKRLFYVLMTAMLLMIGACSNQGEEDTAANSIQNPEESSEASSGTSDKDREAEKEDESAGTSQQSDDQDTNLDHDTGSETSSSPGESEEIKTTNENNFDAVSYLNKKYAIENTHYKAVTWKNEETGKTEYTIKIIPNTKEFSQEMNKKFQNAGMEIYEETELMFNKAEQLMKDLPQLNDQIHVDSVNWVSYDGDFNVMHIQDFR